MIKNTNGIRVTNDNDDGDFVDDVLSVGDDDDLNVLNADKDDDLNDEEDDVLNVGPVICI